MIHGPPGIGRTRLAEAFARGAEERGAARAIRVGGNDPQPGVRGLTHRLLRAQGLAGAELVAQAEAALTGLGVSDADAIARRIGSEDDPLATAWQVLAAVASERPVVVVLDDVEVWDGALALAESGAEHASGPVLLVLLAPADGRVRARLERLLDDPRARLLGLGPLDRDASITLLQRTLDLHPGAALEVEARAAGNPRLAMALAGEWIAEGVLVSRPGGFVLARTTPPPGSSAGAGRLEALLAGHAPEVGRALELAAACGVSFPIGPWAAACAAEGAALPEGAAGALARSGLLEVGPEHAVFPDAAVREALLARARGAGRLAAHHQALARALEGGDDPGTLGVHLAAAGEVARAAPLLLAGAQRAYQADRRERALALVEARQRALAGAGLPDDAPRATLLRAQLLVADWGRVDEGVALLDDLACETADLEVRALARAMGTQLLTWGGRAHDTASWAERAIVTAREWGRTEALSGALYTAAEAARFRGAAEEASALCVEALALDLTDPHRAEIEMLWSNVLAGLGRLDDARRVAAAAVERTSDADSRTRAHLAAGVTELVAGDLAAAEAAFALAQATVVRAGVQEFAMTRRSLAACAAGDLRRARATLEPVVRRTGVRANPVDAAFVRAAWLAAVALDATGPEWSSAAADLSRRMGVLCDPGVAATFEQVAARAEAVGLSDRAAWLRAQAAEQWRRCGRT